MIFIHLLLTALIGFISTNIDDIFLLTLLFAQVGPNLKKREIVLGQYLGLGVLILLSLILSYGLGTFFADKLHYLGLIPIIIGVKAWIDYHKGAGEEEFVFDQKEIKSEALSFFQNILHSPILRVALLIFAGGADNIGIYTPLFARFSPIELLLVVVIFGLLVPVWCFLGEKIANYPLVKTKIEKYEHLLIPFVFIILGLMILFKLA